MATDVVNKADIIMEIREKGLLLSAMFWELNSDLTS